MAGMLDDIQQKRSTLSRGAHIQVNSSINKDEIIKEKNNDKSIDTRSLPQNIRVDNGSRNTVNALGVLGYGDSQRETLKILLDNFISNLSDDEQKKIHELNEIYDKKDLKNYLSKKK
ncbi:DUF5388 domain-containing protein [Melissococcus plutonius]|nr:DUF5388 domain-containing protein [Melissococcus plutonius]KMT26975.1 hypothetical protein MEPL4_8c00100 [Melissococcus plutonius]KMT29108.1 hypothetical protein MEPL7_19p00160 [Melissococcus plutonius]KMT33558.1 hypothetical protein MEPL9_11c00110 [Melissococcus plutonius]KMT37614.1 hypothetical protein MEPL11_12c00010 [Melissococcus plutonius]MCV2499628.1 DUF5388 domain-containing protein [Melissococcus plutonius]